MPSCRWVFNRSATLTRNPLGNTSNVGMTHTASSPWFNKASTANVAGRGPSDGRSQAGGDQRRSDGSGGGGRGSKKLTDRTGYRCRPTDFRLAVTATSTGHPPGELGYSATYEPIARKNSS